MDSASNSASNPVAPTISDNGFVRRSPQNLSANLSAGVWSALAEIGRQLQILANAQMGEGTFCALTLPPSVNSTLPVSKLINEFLMSKARAGRSERYLRALRNSLVKFSYGRATKDIADVTTVEIEDWLHSSGWKPVTMKGYLGDVRTLFSFAVKRGYVVRSPALGVELPEVMPGTVTIHTPEQAKAVLEFARGYNVDICRAMAVRYFAGLRTAEVERIEEKHIRDKSIEVTAINAKTRRRRLVTIQPNLREWLALGGTLPVRGCKSNVWRDFNDALRHATGLPWSHNVTRHSFVSYHLARFQNAGKTALEAGHTEQMLFSNYREVVTVEAAKEYFSIVPRDLA
jgi:integrase